MNADTLVVFDYLVYTSVESPNREKQIALKFCKEIVCMIMEVLEIKIKHVRNLYSTWKIQGQKGHKSRYPFQMMTRNILNDIRNLIDLLQYCEV